jgi:hypothetical protein
MTPACAKKRREARWKAHDAQFAHFDAAEQETTPEAAAAQPTPLAQAAAAAAPSTDQRHVRPVCQPPTPANACVCPDAPPPTRARRLGIDRALPDCTPSPACGREGPSLPFRTHDGAAYVVLFHHENAAGAVRYWFRRDPFKSYATNMHMLTRLVVSLRAVRSRLPLHLFASGYRHAGYEARLQALGVHVHGSPRGALRRPVWADRHHFGSFAKLRVLALTDFKRVVLLDHDLVVLRNIDHLSGAPAPSIVFQYQFPCKGRNRIEARAAA